MKKIQNKGQWPSLFCLTISGHISRHELNSGVNKKGNFLGGCLYWTIISRFILFLYVNLTQTRSFAGCAVLKFAVRSTGTPRSHFTCIFSNSNVAWLAAESVFLPTESPSTWSGHCDTEFIICCLLGDALCQQTAWNEKAETSKNNHENKKAGKFIPLPL